MPSPDELEMLLTAAIDARDADRLELAIMEANRAGLPRSLAPLLVNVLQLDWHTRHEDVAHALQRLRDPSAVEALFASATKRHAYLEYDEFFGLARKCTWALADIGTAEARSRLMDLSRSDNSLIAGYAQRRLDLWNDELDRKRPEETR